MAVNTDSPYSNIEDLVYKYIREKLKYNIAVACGILANIERDSGFNPSAKNSDSGAYGLIQWLGSRQSSLILYTSTYSTSGRNITPPAYVQMEFMAYELRTTEKTTADILKDIPDTAQGAYTAALEFCYNYERFSKDKNSEEVVARAALAMNKYWTYYSGNPVISINTNLNLGDKIVEIARSAKGLSYIPGGNMYNSNMEGADDAGLVYYSYKAGGKEIPQGTARSYYDTYKNTSKNVDSNSVSAADLLFYETSSGISYVAIANGSGGRIYANKSKGIVEETDIGNPSYIIRILSNTETSNTAIGGLGTGFESLDHSEYVSLTNYDPYASIVSANLSRVESEGYDYGYLIDMTHGGEFKFYIPEFSEQAGANWNQIEIRGRSVKVQAYQDTNSRNITISLDLYAGVGLYKANSSEDGEATVDRLHKDAFFLKSLEYPDYTNVITRPPSVVHLILGSAINITGVVSNVVVEHKKPFDKYNRAMYIKVSFTVTQTAINPIDYTDVRNGQYTLLSTGDTGSLVPDSPSTTGAIPDNPPVVVKSTERKIVSRGNTYHTPM